MIGGIFGSTIGVILFNFLKESGNIDLIIKFLYILFLAIIGTLMLVESTISLVKEKTIKTLSKRRSRTILDLLPFKFKI